MASRDRAADLEEPGPRTDRHLRGRVAAIRACVAIAASIENAEARAQALCWWPNRSAARTGRARPPDLCRSRKAVARVQQNGLRGVLAGYLVDSLISTGRFEDARAGLVLYPTETERFVAWEPSPSRRAGAAPRPSPRVDRQRGPRGVRSALYRRVNNGVLAKISNSRQSEFSDRGECPQVLSDLRFREPATDEEDHEPWMMRTISHG